LTNSNLSRREFSLLTGAGLLSIKPAGAQSGPLTARQVVERIKQNLGIPWNDKTYRDTFKAGDPGTPVKGIASTFMSTLDVIQRAKAAGKNFVITHEPTFWSDGDVTDKLLDDPMYKFKMNYIVKSNIVVWRFHDHWHARKPDGIFEGWNKALGWDNYLAKGDARRWEIPSSTLESVARHVAKSLKTSSMRIIGDPKLPVSKVGRGSHTLAGNMAVLPSVDLLVVSEAREWDSIEYVRDTILSGQKKGMLLISHEAGEEAGMDNCARWLRTFITEVPVEFIETHDNFWRPA
jgi:putative NIF3 family GTP cyclohydrolase 1 type 2